MWHVDDIKGLINHIDSARPDLTANGVVIVGHSISGKIAQCLLDRWHLLKLVRGLVLIAPAPSGSFHLNDEMRELQIQAYKTREAAEFAVKNMLLGNPASVDANELDAIVQDALAGSEDAKENWPAYGLAEDHESAVIRGIERKPAMHLMVVVGELDRIETPANVEACVAKVFRAAKADITTKQLKDVGYLIPLEALEALAEAINTFVSGMAA